MIDAVLLHLVSGLSFPVTHTASEQPGVLWQWVTHEHAFDVGSHSMAASEFKMNQRGHPAFSVCLAHEPNMHHVISGRNHNSSKDSDQH